MKSSMLKYKWMCVAVICCAMFAACEPTEVASDKNPISFNNGPARAQEVENADANARIWAYYTTSTETTPNWVWNGEKAKLEIGSTANTDGNFNGTFTVNGNTKYWDNGTYNFYSIYSEDFKDNENIATYDYEDNELTFTYSIANQNELRLATATVSDATNTHNEAVPFQFNHLLSKIKFQAQTTQSTCTIKAFSITVPKTATYTHTTNNTTGAWGAKTGTETLTITPNTEITTTAQTLDLDGTDDTNDNGWLIFPGIVIADNETTADVNEGIAYSITYIVGGTEKTETSTLPPLTDGGLAGNSYIYTFKITPSGPIIFGGVQLVEWIDDEQASIDISFKEN